MHNWFITICVNEKDNESELWHRQEYNNKWHHESEQKWKHIIINGFMTIVHPDKKSKKFNRDLLILYNI